LDSVLKLDINWQLSPELGHWVLVVVVVGSSGFLHDHMVKYAKPLLFVYVFFLKNILKL
jgi:hypothetical protein